MRWIAVSMSRSPRLEPIALLTALVLVVGASMTPPAARAQSTKRTAIVGLLGTSATTAETLFGSFRQSLRDRGWVEGDTLRLEMRYSEGRPERFPELAGELVRLKSDVIVAAGSQATKAAIEATATTPIVFVAVADPIGAGFVASLARPGGHVTGVTNQLGDLSGKIVQLAREVAPRLRHVGILWSPNDPGSALGFKKDQELCASLGIKVTSAPVRSPEDFEAAFEILSRERLDFLMVHPTPLVTFHRQRVAEFARGKRLATITPGRSMVDDGSLMISYGPHFADLFRTAGLFVDKILKGTKPADLPVEQPTKFELVINLKTAKALGLTIPPSVLGRADRVIE
jgi:putative tryptophan/tyrosine transport system substrate-binding protein